jgi:WD40 repeat protein
MPGDKDLTGASCPSDRIESPDGSLLAIAYNSDNRDLYREELAGVVSIHDYKSGERLMVLRGHGSFITSMAFSPDGTLLATGSDDGTVILWQIAQ